MSSPPSPGGLFFRLHTGGTPMHHALVWLIAAAITVTVGAMAAYPL